MYVFYRKVYRKVYQINKKKRVNKSLSLIRPGTAYDLSISNRKEYNSMGH